MYCIQLASGTWTGTGAGTALEITDKCAESHLVTRLRVCIHPTGRGEARALSAKGGGEAWPELAGWRGRGMDTPQL